MGTYPAAQGSCYCKQRQQVRRVFPRDAYEGEGQQRRRGSQRRQPVGQVRRARLRRPPCCPHCRALHPIARSPPWRALRPSGIPGLHAYASRHVRSIACAGLMALRAAVPESSAFADGCFVSTGRSRRPTSYQSLLGWDWARCFSAGWARVTAICSIEWRSLRIRERRLN